MAGERLEMGILRRIRRRHEKDFFSPLGRFSLHAFLMEIYY
jgi:hypothetical protein